MEVSNSYLAEKRGNGPVLRLIKGICEQNFDNMKTVEVNDIHKRGIIL